jgi:hypothetical protein
LKFAWRDQIVGQATPLCVIMLILERTSVQKKYYCTRIASAAEKLNYPTRIDQPRTRIDFEYIITVIMTTEQLM